MENLSAYGQTNNNFDRWKLFFKIDLKIQI